MMTWILMRLKAFFGGGASYVFVGLVLLSLFQNWQVERLRGKGEDLERALEQSRAIVAEKESVIETQNRQFQRQIKSTKELENAQELILSVPDSSVCGRSAAINTALQWLRDKPGDVIEIDDDKPDVSVSE